MYPVLDYMFNLTGIVPPQPPKWQTSQPLVQGFKEI